MAETFERTHLRDDGMTEVTVEITVNGWGSSGSYWEPPEGMEIEITRAWLESDSAVKVDLTEAEAERMEMEFHENPPEADYDEPDDF